MTPVDRDILELLQNEGGPRELRMQPRDVAANCDWGRDAVRKHLLTLRDHEFVEYYDEDTGIYQLSDRGRAFLNGDEDPEGDDFDDVDEE